MPEILHLLTTDSQPAGMMQRFASLRSDEGGVAKCRRHRDDCISLIEGRMLAETRRGLGEDMARLRPCSSVAYSLIGALLAPSFDGPLTLQKSEM